MSLRPIIDRRRNALVASWVQFPLVQVQVEAASALPGTVFVSADPDAAELERLGRRAPRNVVIVRGPGEPDRDASCWVASGYGDYRKAYLAFVKQVYGVDAVPADLAGFDADHLLNRARSPDDRTLIRIEAVPEGANRSWGALFEKVSSDPRFYANRERKRRTMSWMICAKVAGQLPPRGPDDQAGLRRLVSFFSSIGIDAREAQDGLASMLAFAYGKR